MRANYYFGFFIILLFLSSCASLNNVNQTEKKIATPNINKNTITNCPSYYIPKETMFLLNKKKRKSFKD